VGAINLNSIAIQLNFLPSMTYILELEKSQFVAAFAAGIPLVFGSFAVWSRLIKKRGLDQALRINLGVRIPFLASAGLFYLNLHWFVTVILGVLLASLGIAVLFGGRFISMPILAQIIDEADATSLPEKEEGRLEKENRSNKNGEYNSRSMAGSYNGLFQFTLSTAHALANLIIGIALGGNLGENATYIIAVYLILALIQRGGLLAFHRYHKYHKPHN
jgi:Na+/melibiose symporter-like transporter